eukprot:2336416-Prymnesium_polylepis.1
MVLRKNPPSSGLGGGGGVRSKRLLVSATWLVYISVFVDSMTMLSLLHSVHLVHHDPLQVGALSGTIAAAAGLRAAAASWARRARRAPGSAAAGAQIG